MDLESTTADALRRTLARLARSDDHTDVVRSMQRLTREAAVSLGVARASVWLFDPGRTCIQCVDLYDAIEGVHVQAADLTAAEYPAYFEALRAERAIAAHDAITDPRTREYAHGYLAPLRITAMLDVPLWLGGEMVGVACHEHVGAGPRTWTGDEQAFAGSIGDLAALALEACERHRVEQALREREARLREAQRMETLGQLALGVAHDFDNLLTLVLAGADDLSVRVGPDDPGRRSVERIQAAALRAVELCHRLRAFASRPAAEPRVVDLAGLVQELAVLLERILGEDANLRVDPGRGPATVLADRTQLEQIVLNLVLNARDAMPRGGTIDLRVTVRTGAEGRRRVALLVSDTGVGMSPDVLPHVFEPFYTTKATGGSGLGLPLIRGIAEGLGGGVTARSTPGAGSTFEVELPWADPEPTRGDAPAPAAEAPSGCGIATTCGRKPRE